MRMYFNYHAKAQNLIRQRHLIRYEFLPRHNTVSPALVLYFDCAPPMPIRQHRWEEYMQLIKQFPPSQTDSK